MNEMLRCLPERREEVIRAAGRFDVDAGQRLLRLLLASRLLPRFQALARPH